jgi:hypothetical protein
MKIVRKIERRISVTPADIYAALASRQDLPSVAPNNIWFDADAMDTSEVTVVAVEYYTEDLADDA